MWRIAREFDNFRSAATWALERGRTDATVRLAAMTVEAFLRRGEQQIALEWLQLPAELHGRDLVYARAMLSLLLVSTGEVADLLLDVRSLLVAVPQPAES